MRHPTDDQDGFTLIELLVVIVILGILSAVVVFAVRGVNDKGETAAVATDERILRTALETYCARNNGYPPMPDPMQVLVDGKYLSSRSQYHDLTTGTGLPDGRCNAMSYRLDRRNPLAIGPGQWRTGPNLPAPAKDTPLVTLPGTAGVLHIGSPVSAVFDPTVGLDGQGLWTPTALTPGGLFPQALLINGTSSPTCPHCGKVLLHVGNAGAQTDSWHLYDPATHQWTDVPDADTTRVYGVTMTSLDGSGCGSHCGKVLVVTAGTGGTELFDPKSPADPWATTGALLSSTSPNIVNPIASLHNGHALVMTDPPQIYDPAATNEVGGAGAWSNASPTEFSGRRYSPVDQIVVLRDQKVLIASAGTPNAAEIYDPDLKSWAATGVCGCKTNGSARTRAIVLGNGGVLVTGGWWDSDLSGNQQYPRSNYLWSPGTGQWTRTGPLNAPRRNHGAAMLVDGRVLVAGGEILGLDPLLGSTTTELYTPA